MTGTASDSLAESTRELKFFLERSSEPDMDDRAKIIKAVDLLYGSVLDEQDLPKSFKAIADLTGATGIAHVEYDLSSGIALRTETIDVDPAAQVSYQAHFSKVDIRVPPALAMPVGAIVTEHSLVDERVFRSSEIYDFSLRHDVPYIMAVTVSKTSRALRTFSLQRSFQQGRFLSESQEKLAPLIPHLMRALHLRDVLQAARQKRAAFMEVIHRLPFGVIFLDQAQRVFEMSAVAQKLIRGAQCIRYLGGHIRAVHADDDRRLQRALSQAVAPTAGISSSASTIVARSIGIGRALTIAVVPVRSPHLFMASAPACMLVVVDPAYSAIPALASVKQVLQLTNAEALLARVLFTGASLREASLQLRVSINTCKSQLKSIYAKTGCRSHVDLAKSLTLAGIAEHLQSDVSLLSF